MTTLKPTLDLAAKAVIAARTEALFRASGAFRDGHFLLKSGRHGDAYVEKFAVLSDPAATSELCGYWAAGVRAKDGTPLVDLVAGPTTGGVLLAFETARQLGVRSIFAEEVRGADGVTRREFRRGFAIAPGERVLLVDDILTTGGSLLAMLPAVEAMGGEIVECAVLVDRSGGTPTLTSPADGSRLPGPRPVAARPAHLRARRRDLSAVRRRRPVVCAGEHRRGRAGAGSRRLRRGSGVPERLPLGAGRPDPGHRHGRRDLEHPGFGTGRQREPAARHATGRRDHRGHRFGRACATSTRSRSARMTASD